MFFISMRIFCDVLLTQNKRIQNYFSVSTINANAFRRKKKKFYENWLKCSFIPLAISYGIEWINFNEFMDQCVLK